MQYQTDKGEGRSTGAEVKDSSAAMPENVYAATDRRGGGRLTGAGLKDSPSVIVGVHAATDRQGEGMYTGAGLNDSPSVVVIEGVACSDKQLLSHSCNVGAGAHELH